MTHLVEIRPSIDGTVLDATHIGDIAGRLAPSTKALRGVVRPKFPSDPIQNATAAGEDATKAVRWYFRLAERRMKLWRHQGSSLQP
jgi:hypothetical protein